MKQMFFIKAGTTIKIICPCSQCNFTYCEAMREIFLLAMHVEGEIEIEKFC